MNALKSLLLVVLATATFSLFAQQNGIGLDGVDDYIDCGTDASLNITGPVTVEAWIYLTDVLSNYERIVEKDWTNSYYLGAGFNDNSIGFGMDPNSNAANIVETGAGAIGTFRWVHVAGSWDGSTLRIYINGDLAASKAWSNTVDGSANSTKIGKYYAGGLLFEGFMDEIRIWNTARSQTDIQNNLYKELDNPASESNLVAYYRFNEGSGQISADLSANSNTAVFGGTLNVESSDPSWGPSTCPIPYYSVNSGDWNTNSTWATGQLAPTKDWARVIIEDNVNVNSNETSIDVTINPSGALTVASGNTFTVTGDFLIKSDNTGTGSFIDNGTTSIGATTVERYFAEDEWHLISSPISDGQAEIFLGMYLQKYDETSATWTDIVAVTDPLNVMQGYALWIPSSTTYTAEYTGTLNTGNASMPFTANNPFGWNLMGNPYPSAVDWDQVIPVANMNSALYYLDAATGNYVTYVGGIGASRYIPPMQGFWISATGNGSLAFSNSDRTHVGKDTYYKNEIENVAVISATGMNLEDKLYIHFDEASTAGFDPATDAWKLLGGFNEELPQLFSYNENHDMLSIDSRPETETIPAGFNSLTSGEFSLQIDEMNGFEKIIVEDTETGIMHDLTESPYTFSYNTGDDNERFVFHFETITAIIDHAMEPAYPVWSFNRNYYVDCGNEDNATAYLYNLSGQLLNTVELTTGINKITSNLSGNYVVKVVGENGVFAEKVFLK